MSADYGRVKNALKQLGLEESLIHLWHYSRLICNGEPLPHGYRHVDGLGVHMRLEQFAFPHQLDLLAREVMLHADRSGRRGVRSLRQWGDLAAAMNAIRYYGDAVFDGDKDGGVLLTLHRIAHQQLSRSSMTRTRMGRYLALYRFQSLSPFFRTGIGIDVDSYFAMAFAAISASNQRPCSNRSTDYSCLGVDQAASEIFFSRIVGSADEIRNKLIAEQRLGDCWEYTLNALHFKPLVAFDAKHPERLICPLPHAVESRLTEGIFFDVFCKERTFAQAYGDAVEYIVGRMLCSLPPRYAHYKPAKELIGKAVYDGTDWIVHDGETTAHIECKAKRLALPGCVAEKLEDLRREIGHLAEAVLQNYKNIDRATRASESGATSQSDIFSVVVTLEDWLLFSPVATDLLDDLVTEGLQKAGLAPELRTRVPYLIFGAETFQYAIAAMQHHPMSEVLAGLLKPEHKGWVPSAYLHKQYPGLDPASIGNFDQDFDTVVGSILSEAKSRKATGLLASAS